MVTILLAAYNGEKYISEQLDSIWGQSFRDIRLVVSDDASQDRTWEILQEYKKRFPDRMTILRHEKPTGSANANFFQLMRDYQDEYLMLCDQDDVWCVDKVETSLRKIQELEKIHRKTTPLLAYTDMTVVDENLNIISESFREAMNADFTRSELNQIVVQNTMAGCTAIYNRALAEKIIGEPAYMVMHDWWLLLIAGAFGRMESMREQTMLYRQHSSNVMGAKDVRTFVYKLHKVLRGEDIKIALEETYRQAESFLSLYRDQLSEKQIRVLEMYADLPNENKINKWVTLYRGKFWKNGAARKAGQMLFI